jgi:glycine amidinotransferase
MDMNVLSVDENTVLVNDDAHQTIHVLEQNGFTVVPVKLRHCELFGGGIHCSTLDTIRKDEFIDYS